MLFEKVSSNDWGAKKLCMMKDCWTVSGDGHHRSFHASDSPLPPSSARATREMGNTGGPFSCQKGDTGVQTKAQSKLQTRVRPTPPVAVRVTGGCGGDDGDDGGTKSNGVYTFTGKYQNDKPSYKNSNGYNLAYETLAQKNWGAVNLAKADAWTIEGDGHHRYFIASDSETPPLDEWNLRRSHAGCSAMIEAVNRPYAKSSTRPPPGIYTPKILVILP